MNVEPLDIWWYCRGHHYVALYESVWYSNISDCGVLHGAPGSLTVERNVERGLMTHSKQNMDQHRRNAMYFYTILIVVAMTTAVVTATSAEASRKRECDDKMAEAISKFVTSSVGHSHNLLLYMAGVEEAGGVGVDAVRHLGKLLQLDLVDPDQQKELAIILCHAPSLTFLSRTFEVNFELLDNFVETYIKKVYVDKKLDILFTLGDIIMEMLRWTKLTGYPTTPLQYQDGDEVLDFLYEMEERLDVVNDVSELWMAHNQHYPIGLDVDLGEVALLLTGDHSLTTVSERLGLPALELETLSQLDATMLHQYIANVAATLRLYEVARDYGVLDIDWD